MPVIKSRTVLKGLSVGEAMRRQVIQLPESADIAHCTRMMMRHRANAVLLLTQNGIPSGVVSKTDLMGAFYAGLPIETPLSEVMGSQPIACFSDDPVESALEIMEAAKVHRLYITGANREQVIGTISYSDIVGLIYRYCRVCHRGMTRRRANPPGVQTASRFSVKEVMTKDVVTCGDNDLLYTVMELLSQHRMGAVLVHSETHSSVGVISKTDLIVAFHRGVAPETAAGAIMSRPVFSVPSEEPLSHAIQQMLIRDVQRLFVHEGGPAVNNIVGVLALSDAARFRSGSCRACSAGRMIL